MLGKIIKMNKSTARLQLNVEWKQGDVAGQQAKLSNYFAVDGDERPTAGKWFYVKSSRSATSLSSRASRRRPRGEGGEESEPVDARAPQVAHMMHELRRLGHLFVVMLSAVLVVCTSMMQVTSGMTPKRGCRSGFTEQGQRPRGAKGTI